MFVLAVPARKTSKTKKRMRRANIKLQVPNLSACPNCGELRQSHVVCPSCGFYDGRQVVKTNN
ncbi:hypothetical protein FD14_GL001666 [Secundilactobacillus similis DSM 23365 = JCM 2765]|uniref:Large ribosomal subunit protein bL32 n=1 Tax=Secundilactobacillus similis DSM 23365 = JCM 2765 TaxID=1423804 RepID=A0A0R2EU13_9LACO|nr:hypothetical protein FD14_GL001666 [Secundilactobacillus similis DSM 23365 = JCM 2765]